MFIRTERLFLRPGWPEDIEELMALLRDDEFVRNMPIGRMPESVEDFRAYLSRPREKLLPNFFMYLRAAGGATLVGGIGLGRSDADVELGYWISHRFRGRGYAAEAVRAVLAQARALGHRRIVASHFTDNDSSVRVLEGAGFTRTGQTRMRHSHGRRGDAPAHIFAVELTEGVGDYDWQGSAITA